MSLKETDRTGKHFKITITKGKIVNFSVHKHNEMLYFYKTPIPLNVPTKDVDIAELFRSINCPISFIPG